MKVFEKLGHASVDDMVDFTARAAAAYRCRVHGFGPDWLLKRDPDELNELLVGMIEIMPLEQLREAYASAIMMLADVVALTAEANS